MNFVIEENINFYEELKIIDDSENENENEDVCLLSNIQLDNNNIKLPCGHRFNLLPLYKEIFIQKTTFNRFHYVKDKLNINQIKCPYCRQIHDILLPHVLLPHSRNDNKMSYINGVNSPEKYCMSFHQCSHIFKYGKRKNDNCSKTAYFYNNGCYCSNHHKIFAKKSTTTSNKKEDINNENIVKCKAILKYGKRVGQECGSKIKQNPQKKCEFCKKHTSP